MLENNYQLLISKLDTFTRKYYLNQLLRGSLYFIGLVVAIFLVFNLLEGQFYFQKSVRKILFLSFLGTTLLSLIPWVVMPIIKYFKLGKTINHEQAAHIIGEHFVDVKDKLLNILQLKKVESSSENSALITASIAQKTESIKLVPFQSAIDLSLNKRYLKYALPPLFCLGAVMLMSPSLIKDSTYRLFNNNQEFKKAAPFTFLIENKDLTAVQYSDYELKVTTEGDVAPKDIFVKIDNFDYKLAPNDDGSYSYVFRNIQKSTEFVLHAAKVFDLPKKVSVIEKPNITNYTVSLDYPSYTGRSDEAIDNIGDMSIPEGTVIIWRINAAQTNMVDFVFANNGIVKNSNRVDESSFSYKVKATNSVPYAMYLSNEYLKNSDSLSYNINVIKDQYPSINIEQLKDSSQNDVVYFVGAYNDDYGVISLTFNYNITDENGKQGQLQSKKLNIASGREGSFNHALFTKEIDLKPGQTLTYYFEIFDNDGVNGSKSTKSNYMTISKKTVDQLKDLENQNEEAIKDNLKDTKKQLDKLQEKFKKLREKMLQKKDIDWQDKKELEKLLEEQKKLQDKLQEANEKMAENMKNQEELEKPDQAIQEKQEKLKELMEEVASEKDKELMEKIQQLMQELKKEDAIKMTEQFQMQNENTQKKTERLLELYKQLEMEKEVKEEIKKLEDLAKRQDDLAKKQEKEEAKKEEPNAEDAKTQEEIAKEQEKINEEFKKIEKEIKELEKKNKELSPPKDLGNDNQEKMDDIKKDQNDASKKMDSKQSKGASKPQKSAASKMQKMASDMEESMGKDEEEQEAEDIKMIRQLLENLVTVSFDQEELFSQISKTPPTTPKFVDLTKEQFKLKDDFKIIEDSLSELSKRVDKIESFVSEKVTEIKYNMSNSIEMLEGRMVSQALDRQRRTMTNLNDLALMLSESMKNMQKKKAGGMPGAQMCDKPGSGSKDGKDGKSGKVPMDKISEGQQGMEKNLGKLKDKMGKSGKDGPQSKDFAEAAAKQAALRKALQDFMNEQKEQGKGNGGLDDAIEQMNKIETDLVNKKLNAETFKRQNDIVTRLLEAEKSERQRDEDEKRKSESADELKQPLPPAIQEYLKKRQAEIEMYKTVSPSLKPYYKTLVDDYYKALKRG